MFVDHLQATNFRSFEQIACSFSRNVNVIVGKNGAGKTNFLEALYFSLQGNGFRTRQDLHLLNYGASFLRTEVDIFTHGADKTVAISWEKNGKKKITVNGMENQRIVDLFGTCYVVLMTPSTPELVKGGPEYRRKFIDRIHAKENPPYLSILNRYALTYKSRNCLLKKGLRESQDRKLYDTLTHTLLHVSTVIQKERQKTIEKMQNVFISVCDRLQFPILQEIRIVYSPSQLDVNRKLLEEQEIARGTSLIGAHLDRISMKRNTKSLRIYGSEGEQKIVSFVLKLCEFHFLEQETKNVPVVLLDDFQSELDADNFQTLFEFIRPKAQLFLTSLQPSCVKDSGRLLEVRDGSVYGEN
ncbi:MAG: DNA replication and repair protein RecF [Caldisericia bacterium]|nr:DNA replication and repair protein RecF [Caldisericia bacterium]MDD4615200.1 DNA replication and repair protein RecF [Caldisericia bacterium]